MFSFVKWKQLPLLAALLISAGICSYGFSDSPVIRYFLLASILGFILHYFICKNKTAYLINSVIFLIAFVLTYFMILQPFSGFEYYPIDSFLGSFVAGIFTCFAVHYTLRFTRVKKIWLFAMPLFVLPLIKPTGMIPAILLSLFIFGTVLFRLIKERKKNSRKQNWVRIAF